ncbi:RanBP2-type zinc finger protein-like protein [Drosera capensis]
MSNCHQPIHVETYKVTDSSVGRIVTSSTLQSASLPDFAEVYNLIGSVYDPGTEGFVTDEGIYQTCPTLIVNQRWIAGFLPPPSARELMVVEGKMIGLAQAVAMSIFHLEQHKSAAKALQPPQGYSTSPYGASGASYIVVPPYGTSLFNGPSIPRYDVPYSGGSSYQHINYANRGSPFQPVPLSAPPSYSGGSIMGNAGQLYVMPPPVMDRFGLGLSPIAHASMGPRLGFFPEEKSPKRDVTRDNDWTCPKCGNVNFSFRTVCNMRKCNTPKPESQGAKLEKNNKQKMPEGSWKCDECGNINYPFRAKCNRQNCGAEKPSENKESSSPDPKTTEQGMSDCWEGPESSSSSMLSIVTASVLVILVDSVSSVDGPVSSSIVCPDFAGFLWVLLLDYLSSSVHTLGFCWSRDGFNAKSECHVYVVWGFVVASGISV